MSLVRQPAVADRFYPGDPRELTRMLDGFLANAQPRTPPPKAVIVPHAGYIYSGPIAASAYATLAPARESVTRVILMGPSHRVPFRGLATSSADWFDTPLGAVPLDRVAINQALALPQVRSMDEAHALEHSLEVQLPFLQRVLVDFSLAPFVVGDASPESVAEVLELLWGGPETLIVISSDLSHYHDDRSARRLDAATSAAIESLRPDDIGYDQACGRTPVNGLLTVAKRRGMQARTLDLRNSGDTAGSRDQVVGYGAYVFH
ncbi:AmmeMemoRadiSam system protein B [Thiocystis violascens]|uniref:MEMO1 family protein Thivi_4549 n=1 Tax=Thiocystis violascens (strain ATCC 17096 / DSM 198 / 6111) TaxID=765911 RepID=I3YH75_THIV6|nr:AmmeMemoRadiSam system protein B [Thiocystis violascens]AFL76343.1 putative dioxygenase [Thiocystis violascens DSM 198]